MELIYLGSFALYMLIGAGAFNLWKRATGNENVVFILFVWPLVLCVCAFRPDYD